MKPVIRLFIGALRHIRGMDRKWTFEEESPAFLNHVEPPFRLVLLQHGELTDTDEFKAQYVHPWRFEGAGGAFLPVKDGKVGLQRRTRMQTRDMGDYLKCFPDDLEGMVATLGRPSYEIPRGYGDLGNDGEQTAMQEGTEETGRVVVTVHDLGEICDNTAQSPHFISLRCGILGEQVADEDPDPNVRTLPKVEYFDRKGLLQLQKDGLLYCGITLSAIQLYSLNDFQEPRVSSKPDNYPREENLND